MPAISAMPTWWTRSLPAPITACGISPSKAAPNKAPVAKLTRCGNAASRCFPGKARNEPAASTESTPESSVPRTIQARVFKAAQILTRASRPPDERRHPAAFAVTAMREEAARIGHGAPLAPAQIRHSQRPQAAAREPHEVGLPPAARIRSEVVSRTRVTGEEGVAHVCAHLEVRLEDGRTQPGRELGGIHAQRGHGVFEHP